MKYFRPTTISEGEHQSTSLGVAVEFLPELGRRGLVDIWMMFSNQDGARLRLVGVSLQALREIADRIVEAAVWIESQPFLTLVKESSWESS